MLLNEVTQIALSPGTELSSNLLDRRQQALEYLRGRAHLLTSEREEAQGGGIVDVGGCINRPTCGITVPPTSSEPISRIGRRQRDWHAYPFESAHECTVRSSHGLHIWKGLLQPGRTRVRVPEAKVELLLHLLSGRVPVEQVPRGLLLPQVNKAEVLILDSHGVPPAQSNCSGTGSATSIYQSCDLRMHLGEVVRSVEAPLIAMSKDCAASYARTDVPLEALCPAFLADLILAVVHICCVLHNLIHVVIKQHSIPRVAHLLVGQPRGARRLSRDRKEAVDDPGILPCYLLKEVRGHLPSVDNNKLAGLIGLRAEVFIDKPME
mmetsp:Transcript_126719/g.370295  ORF Transcript_126719/g.370295 Transcript_126719/m.370295 type:complete len:322 (-) Transcript_126719:810-1775(-)